MKLIVSIFALVVVGLVALVGINLSGVAKSVNADADYLRLHIRANSNSSIDQDIKYQVKQKIVEEMSPILEGVKTQMDVIERLQSEIAIIEEIANSVIEANGRSYKAVAHVKSEEFPTRVYNSLTVAEGLYDALSIDLGEARGDSWWCVVYPPLCFNDEVKDTKQNVSYKFNMFGLFR